MCDLVRLASSRPFGAPLVSPSDCFVRPFPLPSSLSLSLSVPFASAGVYDSPRLSRSGRGGRG